MTGVVYQPAPGGPYKDPTITVKDQRLQVVDTYLCEHSDLVCKCIYSPQGDRNLDMVNKGFRISSGFYLVIICSSSPHCGALEKLCFMIVVFP